MNEKIVRFDIWCKSCKHSDVSGVDDPCNECLTYPVNEDSTKPVNYKEKDE